MNLAQIETNLQKLVKTIPKKNFLYDLLLAYGHPKASIKRLQIGGLNLSKEEGEVLWKKNVFFKSVKSEDLGTLLETFKTDSRIVRHEPRFILLTNFTTLLAFDRKTTDTLEIPIEEIAKHFDFFLPWAGMEKAQHQNENPADVKAAEKMAEPTKSQHTMAPVLAVKNTDSFMTRMLSCL